MSQRQVPDRRSNSSRVPIPVGSAPGSVTRELAWVVALTALALTGVADLTTGHELWFGPFYLLTIGGTAWFLGWREAVIMGLAALTMILGVNGLNLYPFGTLAAVWNLAMRILTVLMFIGLLGHVRRCYEREWRLARTDPLTGALNRQAFFELAAASMVANDCTMLVYADLDGLKKLNDKRGHAAGDEALTAFVDHVRSVIRKHDHFARLGGDEFIIHLKVRDEVAGRLVAERLHREMNAVAAEVHAALRCSVGALILPPGNRMLDREVLAADALMYEAKQRGAGLVIATLRDVRGSQFLLQHWTAGSAIQSNPVLDQQLARVEQRPLDTAA